MTTWTPTARAALQRSLDQHRTRFAADGAEADEVIADLRDHVEREAEALHLSIVTEADIRRILAQVDPGLLEAPSPAAIGTEPAPPTPSPSLPEPPTPAASKTPTRTLASRLWLGLRVFLGVLLPLGTLIFEWLERPSASELLDPIPTPFHIGLIVLPLPEVEEARVHLR